MTTIPKQNSEIARIEKLLEGIIGETCWGVRLSFGDELRLEVGPKMPNPNLKGQQKGLWRLGTRASRWILEISGDSVVDSNDDMLLIIEKIKLIEGNQIMALIIDWTDLGVEIQLSNQINLKILTVWNNTSKLAHWELFMPDSMFLKMGPKRTWSYDRSDKVVT